MSFVDPEYGFVYDEVNEIVKKKKITAKNVIYLAGVAMQIVETQSALTGSQKKKLVINVLKEAVRLTNTIEDDDKDLLYVSIDSLVPGAIDLIVAGASGELKINMPDLSGCGCFGKKTKTSSANDADKARSLLDKRMK